MHPNGSRILKYSGDTPGPYTYWEWETLYDSSMLLRNIDLGF